MLFTTSRDIYQTVYSNDRQGEATKIVNFKTTRARLKSTLVKMLYFFNSLLLYSQAKIRQTLYTVMISKEWSTGAASCVSSWL